MNQYVENVFFVNPLLFFEIVRIWAGKAFCVLPQQVFEIKGFNALRLLNSTFSYVSKDIDERELRREINCVETEILNYLKDEKLVKILEKANMKVLPFCTLVDRILSSKETPIFPSVYFYVCLKDEKDYVEDILAEMRNTEIELLSTNAGLSKRMKIIKMEGELLGYPKCCINEFVKLKREAILSGKSLTPEAKTILELLDLGMLDYIPKLIENLPFDSLEYIYSLFSLNFYPCSVSCKNAIEIGKSCENFLNQMYYKRAYKCGLFFNIFYHLVTGYKAYTLSRGNSKYLERISKHYVTLKSDVEEVLDASVDVITDIRFINAFINNCVNIK